MTLMFGDIDNGKRLRLIVGDQDVTAGVVDRGDWLEVAYFGKAPRKFPVDVELDGMELRAIAALESLNDPIAILKVVDRT